MIKVRFLPTSPFGLCSRLTEDRYGRRRRAAKGSDGRLRTMTVAMVAVWVRGQERPKRVTQDAMLVSRRILWWMMDGYVYAMQWVRPYAYMYLEQVHPYTQAVGSCRQIAPPFLTSQSRMRPRGVLCAETTALCSPHSAHPPAHPQADQKKPPQARPVPPDSLTQLVCPQMEGAESLRCPLAARRCTCRTSVAAQHSHPFPDSHWPREPTCP